MRFSALEQQRGRDGIAQGLLDIQEAAWLSPGCTKEKREELLSWIPDSEILSFSRSLENFFTKVGQSNDTPIIQSSATHEVAYITAPTQ